MDAENSVQIPDKLFFRIGDVADLVGVKPYVLRYWESEFPVITPEKTTTGQRVYKKTDVETLLLIKHLLYQERYSIEGARKRIRQLRKEGTLQEVRSDAVISVQVETEKKLHLNEIRKAVGTLQELSQRPIETIFNI